MQIFKDTVINDYITKIETAYVHGDNKAFCKFNDEFREFGEKTDNENIALMAKYNENNFDFDENNLQKYKEKFIELIEPFQKEENLYFLMRSYNMLGIIESEMANYYESLNYYILAIHIANAHPEYEFSAILSNNIGNLFVWLSEYDSALPNLLRAYQQFHGESVFGRRILPMILINLIECYGYLKQFDESYAWSRIEVDYTDIERHVIDNLLLCNDIEDAFMKKKFKNIEGYIYDVIQNASHENEYIYHFRTFLRCLEVCIHMKDKMLCDKIIEIMETLNEENCIETFLFDYADLKIQYYQMFLKGEGDNCTAEAYMDAYYKHSSSFSKQLKSTYTSNMNVRLKMEEIELNIQNIMDQNVMLKRDIQLDHFTQLYNKTSIKEKIDKALQDGNNNCALFLIDIDHFKKVNDTFGHKVGDELLLEVVSILRKMNLTLIGRFGGDEFVAFVDNVFDEKDIASICQNLLVSTKSIVIRDDKNHKITFSIGAARSLHSSDFDQLFQKADEAMYESKSSGRNCFVIYKDSL